MARKAKERKAKGKGRRRITPEMRNWADAVKRGDVRRDARGRIVGRKRG